MDPTEFAPARPIEITEAERRYQAAQIFRLFQVPEIFNPYSIEYKARLAERRARERKRMRRNRQGRNPRV